jgi:hypothetical protein
MRYGLALAGALLLLLSAMAFKDLLVRLPAAPDTPTADRFDANRAAARLARILGDQRPHPVDSAENDAVRDRIVAELRALGLQPRVSDDLACNGYERARFVACARVRNIVATMGPGRGRHLVLSSHYDSTFAGPGAADAGIGVATLLEVAARLRGRRLARPVTFLINEGEEMGLIGARAFVERDPLAPQVEALLNFEARGVTGPAAMFETSRPNAAPIAAYARAVDRPLANSMMTDFYRLIPNATDVDVYQERPWTILNFAIIGNETRYHSPGDNLAAFDRRSLQHMGDQALALTLQMATGQAATASGDRIYTDLLGLQLITLPLLFGLVLLGVLLFFFLVETWRRRAFGRPLLAMAAAMIGSAALAWIGQLILGLIRGGAYWRGFPIVTEIAVYGSALAACLLALTFIGRDCDRTRLRAAFWLLFVLGGTTISFVAPGGSIFFLLPPLLAAGGMALERWWRGAERAGAILAALALFLSFAPILALFEELMNNGPHWMFAPLGALLMLPVLVELRPLLAQVRRGLLLAGAADLFLLPWAAAALTPAYSEARPQKFTIEYHWDAEARRGLWAVDNDGAALPYGGDWQRTTLPYSTQPRWTRAAPPIEVPAAEVERVAERRVAGGRRLTLRLRMNGNHTLILGGPPDAGIRAAGIGTFVRRIGGGETRYGLRCVGRSCDGALFEIFIGGTRPVEFNLLGMRSGLPAQGEPLVRGRPARAQPQYWPDTTITVRKIRL